MKRPRTRSAPSATSRFIPLLGQKCQFPLPDHRFRTRLTWHGNSFQDHMDKFHPGEPIEKGFAAYL